MDYYCDYLAKFGVTIYAGSKEFLDDFEKTTISTNIKK